MSEPLPDICGPADVARALCCSYRQVMRLQKAGRLRKFELAQPVSGKRYSGRKLERYRSGEDDGLRYFGKARAS